MINEEKVNAPNINLVNTNGAGDALLGSYLALESKLGKLEALREAVNYASKICSINTPRLT
jgi:sugar/nucleoside kinase (ribokinase family)